MLKGVQDNVDLPTLAERIIEGIRANDATMASKLERLDASQRRGVVRDLLLRAEETMAFELTQLQRGIRTSINPKVPDALARFRAYRIRHYEVS